MQILSNSNELLCDARSEIRTLWCRAFQVEDLGKAEDAWAALELAFAGKHPEFEAIDAPYHDLEHTLRACFCYVQLAVNNQQISEYAPLPLPIAELGLIAILFHDTGYLKNKGDAMGTGAKYAFGHVDRSQEFAEVWMLENDFNPSSIQEVRAMIQSTDFNADTQPIPFASDSHCLAGCMVGTADLLGQMASPDYISKLPLLHQEMMEALKQDQTAGVPIEIPASPQDLLLMTPGFFTDYVLPKLTGDYQGVFRLLNAPYPKGRNPYMDQIHHHLDSIPINAKQKS